MVCLHVFVLLCLLLCAHICSLRISFEFGGDSDWLTTDEGEPVEGPFTCAVWDFSSFRRWRSHCVIPCTQTWQHFECARDRQTQEKSSCGTSEQIKACLLLCFNGTISAYVCVCELLPSFIPAAVWGFVLVHTDLWMWLSPCMWMVSHLLPSPCACTHVDTLSLTAVCVPTRGGTPYPLCLSVCLSSRHSIPPTPCMYYMQKGTLFLSFTMETRHVLIPSSFPVS